MASIPAIKLKARQAIAEAEAERASAVEAEQAAVARHHVEMTDTRLRHQQELAGARRTLDVASTKLDALRYALSLIEEIGEPDAAPVRRRSAGSRRGRSMSEEWNAWLSRLPVAPADGMEVGPFVEIVHRDRPDMPRNNVRSQLSNMKNKGWVELVDKGWRLTKPLAVLLGAAHENEGTAVPSDAEAPAGIAPAGASDFNPPLLSFPARTAA
jgi:hypothetical protein